MTMAESILINPNSYENLNLILDELKKELIDSKKKKWVSVGADGPPYCLMRRIIKEKNLDCFALVSGLGHLNMNQLKTYFAIGKHICFDVLGQDILNFKTSKAVDFFFACKDTHKTWQAFEIFLQTVI